MLFQGTITSVISAYAPQFGWDDSQKDAFNDGINDHFYDSCISIIIVRKLGYIEIVVTAGDSNGHVGSNQEDYDDQHGRYS